MDVDGEGVVWTVAVSLESEGQEKNSSQSPVLEGGGPKNILNGPRASLLASKPPSLSPRSRSAGDRLQNYSRSSFSAPWEPRNPCLSCRHA